MASNVVIRSLAAALVAALLLVFTVLPAEYDYDPTGVGEWLGLKGLSTMQASTLTNQESVLAQDALTFELLPFESLEYKYRLEQGAAMVFSWNADSELVFDLHAEPDGAPLGFAESFARGKGRSETGNYVAPYAGIHGWFWENRGLAAVKVTLLSTGFFTAATLYRDGFACPRNFGGGVASREEGLGCAQ
jgi:hypothetical protein